MRTSAFCSEYSEGRLKYPVVEYQPNTGLDNELLKLLAVFCAAEGAFGQGPLRLLSLLPWDSGEVVNLF